jgi:hypothetical protein
MAQVILRCMDDSLSYRLNRIHVLFFCLESILHSVVHNNIQRNACCGRIFEKAPNFSGET